MFDSIRKYVLLFCLLFPAFSVFGIRNEAHMLFNTLKVEDGLPSNEIFKVIQDSVGFMWFATNSGFVRYDGYDMDVFRQNNLGELALPDNQLTSIVNAINDGFWISSYKGLIYYNSRNGSSELVDLGGPREIRCLFNQGDSILWAGSSQGLFKIDSENFSFQLFTTENSNLGSDIVRALHLDNNSNLWIGTFDGLNVLKLNGSMAHFNLKGTYKPELKNNLILDIKPYNGQNDSLFWIGTETGLVLFNSGTSHHTTYSIENTSIENEVVKCIFTNEAEQVYIGTDYGFYRINTSTGEVRSAFHDPFNNYSISNNVIWDIFEDNAGILWLSTSNGISKLKFNTNMFSFTPVFTSVNSKTIGTQVNDIYLDENNTTWLATKNGVIAKHNDGHEETFTANSPFSRKLVFNNINTISGDHLGRIWIGSAGGINVWDTKQRKMYTITANFNLNAGLRSNYISAFITPKDGSFWVTTWGGGMYKCKGDFSDPEKIIFNYVANFNTNLCSSNNKIWLQDANNIFSIDLNTEAIESKDELSTYIGGQHINTLLISKKGYLWIGTHNLIIRYNIHTGDISESKVITGSDGDVLNLLEDHKGQIWGTTLTSIFKFSDMTSLVEVYPKDGGIPLDNFLYESKALSREGMLFFGGNDGFISFYPDEIKKNTLKPNVVFTSIVVNNKDIKRLSELGSKNIDNTIAYANKLNLKYDQHSFTIRFSSLHFENSERNIYAYKLKGYDSEWLYTAGSENFASYSNLSTGNYQFLVKGTNNDGVWSDKILTLDILVNPPIWAGTIAVVFYLVILILLLFLLAATYRNKARWKEKIRTITLEKEKNEELTKSKQQFFTNTSHEFRTPLSLIFGPVQTLLANNKLNIHDQQLIQLISKNTKRLMSLVDQMLDLRRIETNTLTLSLEEADIIDICKKQFNLFIDLAAQQNIHFNFKSSVASVKATIDINKFDSILQNLLSNAFKFTSIEGLILLEISMKTADVIQLKVSDSGKGISADEQENIFKRFYQGEDHLAKTSGYGIGLNIVKEYCELMKGSVWFESLEGKGTSFFVEIPIEYIDDIVSERVDIDMKNNVQALKQIPNNRNLPVILFVDDNPDTLKFLELNFQNEFQVIAAGSGEHALSILKEQQVDLIISDVVMPEMDGVSFCRKVKQHPKYEAIPLILLTAKTMDSEKIEGIKAGADAYLTKPFDIELLQVQIQNLWSKSQKINDHMKRKLIVANREIGVESSDEKLLKEVITYINNHISFSEINLSEMCRTIGVSHSSLYRKVKAQTGMSLNELIRNVKLQKAAQLIKTGKLSIAEIIDETGFSNHSYFAKCFKKVYKISPREYGIEN